MGDEHKGRSGKVNESGGAEVNGEHNGQCFRSSVGGSVNVCGEAVLGEVASSATLLEPHNLSKN